MSLHSKQCEVKKTPKDPVYTWLLAVETTDKWNPYKNR